MSIEISTPDTEVAPQREYFYPNAGVVVVASSKEEADKKLAVLNNKATIKN